MRSIARSDVPTIVSPVSPWMVGTLLSVRSKLRYTGPLSPPYESRHTLAFSRRDSSEFFQTSTPENRRGRREGRVQAAPMARLQQETQAAVTTGTSRTSGL